MMAHDFLGSNDGKRYGRLQQTSKFLAKESNHIRSDRLST